MCKPVSVQDKLKLYETLEHPTPRQSSFLNNDKNDCQNLENHRTKENKNDTISSQNNTVDSKDIVFHYGLKNGVMYTASVKIINDLESYKTNINITGKDQSFGYFSI